MLPLGGPRSLGRAEELLDLHVAVGELEDRAERLEESVDAVVIAGPGKRAAHVELDVLGEDVGQRVSIVLEDCCGHAVDRCDVRVFAHGSSGRGPV